jgi:uncharacterized protein (DUF427 family)
MRRVEPGPGEESVWDYPRPPRLEPTGRRLRVVLAGQTIAETRRGHRVLETSHPPTYYFPPEDVDAAVLRPSRARASMCEWKGAARYFDLVVSDRAVVAAAWCYPRPTPAFAAIRDHLCFYPSKVDACFVDDEQVQAQEGDFYGGWITSWVVGPFKGGPGSWGW